MGTWSHEPFGNDTACDWAAALADGDSLRPVEQAIEAVARAPAGDLDADIAVEALAAAEVVARLRGRPGEDSAYTAPVDAWVLRTRHQPPAALVRGTLAALDRIVGADSELHALWAEGDELADWLASIDDLRRRLAAPAREPTAAPATDPVAELVRRVGALAFRLPPLPDGAPLNAVYQQAAGGGALGDHAAVQDAIERLWGPIAQLDKPAVAFDLAVRDAQALAAEGRLDEALDGLEAWRGAPGADEPGMFDMRAAGVCLAAGDSARMAALRSRALADAPHQRLWQLDEPLYEARAGSEDAARQRLDAMGDLADDAALALVLRFIRGVLACRRRDPSALALLTPVAEDFIDKCLQGTAAWSLGSAALGWWALALAQAGRHDEAGAVVAALRPVLLQAHNERLVALLRDAAVLAPDTALPARAPRVAFGGQRIDDHGAFRSRAVRGVNALPWIEAQRRQFAAGHGPYPFLIGDDEDLRRLLADIAPPADGGRAVLDAAAAIDAGAWLKPRARRRKPAWPREAAAPRTTPSSLFDPATQRLKPVLHVGLVDLADPCDLFARLGWGGGNDCPTPAVHVALHRHWRDRFGAEPLAVSSDVIDCRVARPPATRDDALALALSHEAYCPDVVEQGTGSAARLGASLLAAPYWSFWWD